MNNDEIDPQFGPRLDVKDASTLRDYKIGLKDQNYSPESLYDIGIENLCSGDFGRARVVFIELIKNKGFSRIAQPFSDLAEAGVAHLGLFKDTTLTDTIWMGRKLRDAMKKAVSFRNEKIINPQQFDVIEAVVDTLIEQYNLRSDIDLSTGADYRLFKDEEYKTL